MFVPDDSRPKPEKVNLYSLYNPQIECLRDVKFVQKKRVIFKIALIEILNSGGPVLFTFSPYNVAFCRSCHM